MEYDIIRVLNSIFFNMGDVYKHIFSFYNKESIDKDAQGINLKTFINVCDTANILNFPSELFLFLDAMGIKVAVFPMLNSEEWSFRVYHDNEINIIDGFKSRNEATLKGIETAFSKYHKNTLKNQKND